MTIRGSEPESECELREAAKEKLPRKSNFREDAMTWMMRRDLSSLL